MNRIFIKSEDGSVKLTEERICTYYFSVIWNIGAVCNLYVLNGQIPPNGSWHQIISTMITDSDGEITVKLGDFGQGTVVNIIFGIQAITDITNAAIIITNATTKVSKKVLPKELQEMKSIAKGQTWNDKIFNYVLH